MVQNWLLKCEEKSAHGNSLEKLPLQDAKSYRKYLRMNTGAFEITDYIISLWKIIIRLRLKRKNDYYYYYVRNS